MTTSEESIRQLFASFTEKEGKIKVSNIPILMEKLGRSPDTAQLIIERLSPMASAAFKGDTDEYINIDGIVSTLGSIESPRASDIPRKISSTAKQTKPSKVTTTPLMYMISLESYRLECEEIGDYVNAKKARERCNVVRNDEIERQASLIKQAQAHEMSQVEDAQKAQLTEFGASWDKYMSDYEAAAYISLERLREKHIQEFNTYREQIRTNAKREVSGSLSRELVALRQKQHAVAKLGRYQEAHQLKTQCDKMEKAELAKSTDAANDRMEKLEELFKAKQAKTLSALLKRVQRDRAEQVCHRQGDVKRIEQRNKNLKADLVKRQNQELVKARQILKSILSQPEQTRQFLNSYDPDWAEKYEASGELPSILLLSKGVNGNNSLFKNEKVIGYKNSSSTSTSASSSL